MTAEPRPSGYVTTLEHHQEVLESQRKDFLRLLRLVGRPVRDSREVAAMTAEHLWRGKTSDGITLDEFTANVLDTLAEFRAEWQHGQVEDAAQCPARQHPADWWAAFREFEPASLGRGTDG